MLKKHINYKILTKRAHDKKISNYLFILFMIILIVQVFYFEFYSESIFYFIIVLSVVDMSISYKNHKESKEYLLHANNLIFSILTVILIFMYRIL